MFTQEPNDNGIIEQFDGYFNLEDVSIDEVRSRLLDPKEYWGGAYGVAGDTQVIKQADVAAMLSMFKNDYSTYVREAEIYSFFFFVKYVHSRKYYKTFQILFIENYVQKCYYKYENIIVILV